MKLAIYVTKALQESRMSRADLAAGLGVSPGRINQLLSVRGDGEFERVPLDLWYQIAHVTGVPFALRSADILPLPTCTKKEPPIVH